MNSAAARRLCALMTASALATVGCGLKPEVKEQLREDGVYGFGGEARGAANGAAGGAPAGGSDFSPQTSGGIPAEGAGTAEGAVTVGPGDSADVPGAPGSAEAASDGAAAPAPGTARDQAQPAPEGPGTTTGIDFKKKTITIVVHGPMTGAGVPQESFRSGGPSYWDKSGPNGGPRLVLGGFRVIAEAADDKYNPQDALRACNAAAKRAFLIFALAGADQIQACGQSQVLRREKVPYISFGVGEKGLAASSNYFAASLTYRQQTPLIIKMARDNGFLAKRWAVVIPDTPNFTDVRESIVSELRKAKVQGKGGAFGSDDVYLTDKAPRDCVSLGTQLRGGRYESVYFLGQPLFFGQCVSQHPSAVYAGPGPSFGVQAVADLACSGGASSYRGYYLHPTPDKQTTQQQAKGAPPFRDDIESGIWGGMQQIEQAFGLVRGPLSRERFIAALASAGVPGGVTNATAYNGGSRFGGTGAYVNKLSCNGTSGVVKTIANYKR